MLTHTKVYGQMVKGDSIQLVEGFVESGWEYGFQLLYSLCISWQTREVLAE